MSPEGSVLIRTMCTGSQRVNMAALSAILAASPTRTKEVFEFTIIVGSRIQIP